MEGCGVEGHGVEGHRVKEVWPTLSSLTTPCRESVSVASILDRIFFRLRSF